MLFTVAVLMIGYAAAVQGAQNQPEIKPDARIWQADLPPAV